MRAVQVTSLAGPSAVELVELPEPAAAGGKVLIEVEVAGVNFPDVLMTKGQYQIRPALPFVPGSEVAGRVRSAPEGCDLEVGDRVAAFPGLGGFAEVVAAHQWAVFPLPDGVSFEAGAALLMNYLTVHFALKRRGRLANGEILLVHGAAGGIGTAGIQLGKAFGARVIAVASSPEKQEVARLAGADEVVGVESFKEEVSSLTGGAGVDVVLDPVGGDRFTDSLRTLRPEGRLLVVGFTEGHIPTVKVNRLLHNNLDVVGVGWGAFWIRQPQYLRQQWDEVVQLVTEGVFSPPIGESLPLERAADALLSIEERRALGKLVLRPRTQPGLRGA